MWTIDELSHGFLNSKIDHLTHFTSLESVRSFMHKQAKAVGHVVSLRVQLYKGIACLRIRVHTDGAFDALYSVGPFYKEDMPEIDRLLYESKKHE